MKKVTIVILAMVWMTLFIGVEFASGIDIQGLTAMTERNSETVHVIRMNRHNDKAELTEKLKEIVSDVYEYSDDELWIDVLQMDEHRAVLRVTKGVNNIGKADKERLVSVIFE